jgi:hypothetical protein
MTDPYCGWNIRKNTCEGVDTNTNLIALNANLCSRFPRQESVKSIHLDSGATAKLDCNILEKYLYDFVEWKKDEKILSLNENIILTESKGIFLFFFLTISNSF